jgi:hypothetical protein
MSLRTVPKLPKSISKNKRVLCVRIQDMHGIPQVQSFVDECERCHVAVWRAESVDRNAIAICSRCATPDLTSGQARILPLSPQQIADIKKARALENGDGE